jgi:hypothetical protein
MVIIVISVKGIARFLIHVDITLNSRRNREQSFEQVFVILEYGASSPGGGCQVPGERRPHPHCCDSLNFEKFGILGVRVEI